MFHFHDPQCVLTQGRALHTVVSAHYSLTLKMNLRLVGTVLISIEAYNHTHLVREREQTGDKSLNLQSFCWKRPERLVTGHCLPVNKALMLNLGMCRTRFFFF